MPTACISMFSRRSKPKTARPANLYACLAGDTSSLTPANASKSPAKAPPSHATGSCKGRVAGQGATGRKPPSETEIQSAIIKALRLHPAVAWVGRYNSGGMYNQQDAYIAFNSVPGQSDLMGMLQGGLLFALEVKVPGGKLTPLQKGFIDRVQKGGGIAAMVTSIDEALDAINRIAGR